MTAVLYGLRLPCLRCYMHQPSIMWGRTGGVWVCGGLIPSLKHHICINRQICGVKLGVWMVNTVTSTSRMHQPSTMWGCMGAWRVNTVTSTSHMHQPSTMWARTRGVWVCGGLIPSLQHHICINRQLCGLELGVYGCVEG